MHGAEKEIAGLKSELELLIEKKNAFSKESHLAVDPNQKFSLTSQISDLEQQIADKRARISEMEQALPDILPVFKKLNISELHFGHCLRPAQTKFLISELPTSINVMSEMGQGRHRLIEDLEVCGLRESGIQVVNIKLAVNSYDNFLREVARQAEVDYTPGKTDVFDLLRQSALHWRRPVLLIVENLGGLFNSTPQDIDPAFTLDFLHQLNALKNCSFAALLVSSYKSVNHRRFLGWSSPLTLKEIQLNQLSYEDLKSEVARLLPDLSQELCAFIAEQFEYDPNQTYYVFSQLLHRLDGRTRLTRDFIGQEIASLRKNLLKNGRK